MIDSCGNIKLCDFGFSKNVSTCLNELSETYCGSKAYASPEILLGQPYEPKKADVWALGVIFYIFLTGNMPFKEDRYNATILDQVNLSYFVVHIKINNLMFFVAKNKKHKSLKMNFCIKNGKTMSATVHLVRWIFTLDWNNRPSILEILDNECFTHNDTID